MVTTQETTTLFFNEGAAMTYCGLRLLTCRKSLRKSSCEPKFLSTSIYDIFSSSFIRYRRFQRSNSVTTAVQVI